MKFRGVDSRIVAGFAWLVALIVGVLWAQAPKVDTGWDLQVYQAAMSSVQADRDPYVDGMARQDKFHAEHHPPNEPPPYTYVYSPITLPLVKLATMLPALLAAVLYWSLYGAAVIAAVWVCVQMVQRREALVFTLVAPAAIFFPGLQANDVVFSGNVAYILHGAALLAAYRGWKRGQWLWFYGVVLFASCFKAPILYLLAIPVLSAYRQWRPAIITGALGVAIFAVQPLAAPVSFRHYLQAVELQFSYNHDFSSSPAGLLADRLYDLVPYQVTSGAFYALYGAIVFWILFRISRTRFLTGRITLKQWVPLLLLGVLLLNPRIMEYDIAPVTVAMMLVFWRFLVRGTTIPRAAYTSLCFLGALNIAAPLGWRTSEGIVMVCLFAAGAWDLLTSRDQFEAARSAGAAETGIDTQEQAPRRAYQSEVSAL